MKRKLLCISLALTLSLTLLAGCGGNTESAAGGTAEVESTPGAGGEDRQATLTMYVPYGDENSKKVVDYAAEKVQETFPGVSFEYENYPQDGGQTIKARAATGDLPDIIIVDDATVEVLSKSNSILALDEYYERFNYEDYLRDSAIENSVYSPDGHIYQFTTGGVSPVLWYYNADLFEEYDVKVPTNYDELLEAVVAFNENDIVPFAMFGKEPWPLGAFFDSFALKTTGEGLVDLSTGAARADDAEFAAVIEKIATLIDAGIFQKGSSNTDFDTASALFTGGQAAMFLNGSWYLSDLAEKMPDSAYFMPYYPTGDASEADDNKNHLVGASGTQGFAVNSSVEDPDFVAEVAALFAYHRNVAEYSFTQFITGPIKTDGLELEAPLSRIAQELLPYLGDYEFHSTFLHVVPNTKFATGFAEELQKFYVGESAEEFTHNVNSLIDASIG